MTNDDSYAMLHALRKHLNLKVYKTDKTLEIVLTFKTNDGKVQQVCNSFKESVDAANNN